MIEKIKYNTRLEHLFCIVLRLWVKMRYPRWYEYLFLGPILRLASYLDQDWSVKDE